MATYSTVSTTTQTLSGTTADTVNILQWWDGAEVSNTGTTPIYVRADGTAAVAAEDGTYPIPAGSSRVLTGIARAGGIPGDTSEPPHRLSIVGDGNGYTVAGIGITQAADASAGTASARSLGPLATQAAPGDLSSSFAPAAATFSRLFSGPGSLSAYQSNAAFFTPVPSTDITAIAKTYTCPTGYYAVITPVYIDSASGATVSIFIMADADTTPQAADRFSLVAVSAGAITATSGPVVLDEGASMWAFATANSISLTPTLALFRKPIAGPATYTNVLTKGLSANTDNVLYTCPAGCWAQSVAAGIQHNTTSGSIATLTKVYRSSDTSTWTTLKSTVTGNSQANIANGNQSILGPGDRLILNPAATGMNASIFMVARPL